MYHQMMSGWMTKEVEVVVLRSSEDAGTDFWYSLQARPVYPYLLH